METRGKSRSLFGWTSAGPLSCLTAQCDFTVLFLGFLREWFPRPVMLARASVFPQALSRYDLSLLTVLFGQHNASASPHLWRAQPWGHPGRLPCTAQIKQRGTARAHVKTFPDTYTHIHMWTNIYMWRYLELQQLIDWNKTNWQLYW